MRYLIASLLGLGLTLGIACGGGDDGPSADGGSTQPTETTAGSGRSGGGTALQDACALLSDAQVNAALGDDEVAGTQGQTPTEAASVCQWDGSITGNRYVHLTLRTVQNAAQPFESNYRSVAGAVAIAGVGDEAYALPGVDTPNNYRFMTAAALTSSLYIQVNVAGSNRSDDDAVATLTTLMQQVLANLE